MKAGAWFSFFYVVFLQVNLNAFRLFVNFYGWD